MFLYLGVNGEEKADFIPIVAWEKLAEICGNNLTKGRLVLLEGRLQFRSYETEAGEKRKVAEVIALYVEFMDRPKDDTSSKTAATGENIDFSEFGEDLPF